MGTHRRDAEGTAVNSKPKKKKKVSDGALSFSYATYIDYKL